MCVAEIVGTERTIYGPRSTERNGGVQLSVRADAVHIRAMALVPWHTERDRWSEVGKCDAGGAACQPTHRALFASAWR